MEVNDIFKFLSYGGIFQCAQRGGKKTSSDNSRCLCNIRVQNVFFRKASERQIKCLERLLNLKLTPSHKSFLSNTNGGIFFSQPVGSKFQATIAKILYGSNPLEKNTFGLEGGLRLYSVKEIPIACREVRQNLYEMIEDSCDESNLHEKQQLKKWVDNILVIGEEMNSGNYILIDYNRKCEFQEYPVVFLDHEVSLSCADISDNTSVIARNLNELLLIAVKDPADFLMHTLGSTMTMSDGVSDKQWYPIKYIPLENGMEIPENTIMRGKLDECEYDESLPVRALGAIYASKIVLRNLSASMPNEVISEELMFYYSAEKISEQDRSVVKFIEALICDLDINTHESSEKLKVDTISKIEILGKELTQKQVDNIMVLVLIENILNTASNIIPVASNSWLVLATLGSKLYESLVANVLSQNELEARAKKMQVQLKLAD